MIGMTANNVTLLKELGRFSEPVAVYDPEGQLLGLFVPANLGQGKDPCTREAPLAEWAEIERRRRSGEESYPFEVVRERLQRLQAEVERRRAAGEKELTEEEAVAFIDRLRQQAPAPVPSPTADAPAPESGPCATP